MYKIFFDDRIIYLTDDKNKHLNYNINSCHYIPNIDNLNLLIDKFEADKKKPNIYIYSDNLDKLFKDFQKCCIVIEAAGGIVRNGTGYLLFIKRRGKWDLPKGKIDEGENPSQAAFREIGEETGINKIFFITELQPTYHTYWIDADRILKKTYWFKYHEQVPQKPVPQAEEDITEVKWINPEKLKPILENTYGSVIDVLKEAGYVSM
jgi:8-oxo-dGTP pyrophosphatase MutT (NUDIX family)